MAPEPFEFKSSTAPCWPQPCSVPGAALGLLCFAILLIARLVIATALPN